MGNRLIKAGVLLFLLGLLSGFAVPLLASQRLALSSHIEGVMNGTVLIVIGLIWSKIQLSEAKLKLTSALLLYGTYTNWFTLLLAGIWGAGSAMLPIAGANQTGTALQEAIVKFGLVSLALAMTGAFILILLGLQKPAKEI